MADVFETLRDAYQDLVRLNVAPKPVELETDNETTAYSLLGMCQLLSEVVERTNAIASMRWHAVPLSELETLREEASRFIDDVQRLPDECSVSSAYTDAARRGNGLQSMVEVAARMHEFPVKPHLWKAFFTDTVPLDTEVDVLDFTLGHLHAATQRHDHQAQLDVILARAKKEEEISESIAEVAAQFRRKPAPVSNGALSIAQAVVCIRELRDSQATLARLVHHCDSPILQKVCQPHAEALESVIELLDSVVSVTRRSASVNALLFSQAVRDSLPREVGLADEASQKLEEISRAVASAPGGLLFSLSDDTEAFARISETVRAADALMRDAAGHVEGALTAAKQECSRLYLLRDGTIMQFITAGVSKDSLRSLLPLLYASVADAICEDEGGEGGGGDAPSTLRVCGVVTTYEDRLLFDTPLVVECGSPFTRWVGSELDAKIGQAIHKLVHRASRQNESFRDGREKMTPDYFERFPCQTSLLGMHMLWTYLVEGTLGVPCDRPPPPRRTSSGRPPTDVGGGGDEGPSQAWRCTAGQPPCVEAGLGSVAGGPLSRPQSAGMSITSNRPLSANMQRTVKRPATAEHRLRQLTTPLAPDSTVVRPSSAVTRVKGKADEIDRPVKQPRRTSMNRGKGKKEEVVDPSRAVVRMTDEDVGDSTSPESGFCSRGLLFDAEGQQGPAAATAASPHKLPVGNALEVGRSRWVTGLGATEARSRLRDILQQLTHLSLTFLTRLRRTQVEACANHMSHLVSLAECRELQAADSPDDFAWQRHMRVYPTRSRGGYTLGMGCAVLVGGTELHDTQTRCILSPTTAKLWLHTLQGTATRHPPVAGGEAFAASAAADLAALGGRLQPTLLCTPDTTSQDLRAFFLGVAATGGWGVLRHVSNLTHPVASSASALAEALCASTGTLSLGGMTVPAKPGALVLGTSGCEAGACPQVPAELTSQFRCLALPPQDLCAVAGSVLCMSGFTEQLQVAQKLQVFFEILREREAQHGDGSLSSALGPMGVESQVTLIRAAARKAGSLMRRSSQSDRTAAAQELLVAKALKEVLEAAVSPSEFHAVSQLVTEVFPGQQSFVHHLRIKQTLSRHVGAEKLVAHPEWLQRVVSLYELQAASSSVLVIGPAFSGKTEALNALRQVLKAICCEPQPEKRLYPKSYPASEFWGYTCEVTREWKLGVFPKAVVTINKTPGVTWLVLDAPAESLGEALALSEGAMHVCRGASPLQLPILMKQGLTFVVETSSIASVSPGVITQFACACFDEAVLPWQAHVARWANSCDPGLRNQAGEIQRICTKNLQHAVDFVAGCAGHIVSAARSVVSLLETVEAFLRGIPEPCDSTVTRIFWWSVCWIFAAQIPESAQAEFHSEVVQPHLEQLPEGATTLWDVLLLPDGALTPLDQHDFGPSWHLHLKATTNDQRLGIQLPHLVGPAITILQTLHQTGGNVLFYGPPGSGKSCLLSHYLASQDAISWTKVAYSRCPPRSEFAEGIKSGRCFFVDDVNESCEPLTTQEEPSCALYEMMAKTSTRSLVATAGSSVSCPDVKRLLSKFTAVHCAVTKPGSEVAFSTLLSSMWPDRDPKVLACLGKAVHSAISNLCKGPDALPRSEQGSFASGPLLSCKLLKDVFWSMLYIPPEFKWSQVLSVLVGEVEDHLRPFFTDPPEGFSQKVFDVCDASLQKAGIPVQPDAGRYLQYTEIDGKKCSAVFKPDPPAEGSEMPSAASEATSLFQQHCPASVLLYPSLVAVGMKLSAILPQVGRHIALIGPSGSGKVTISRCVARYLKMELAENLYLNPTASKFLGVSSGPSGGSPVKDGARDPSSAPSVPGRKGAATPPFPSVLAEAAQGKHACVVLSQRCLSDPRRRGLLAELLNGELCCEEGPDAMKTYLEELVSEHYQKSLEVARYFIPGALQHPQDFLVKSVISKFLHVIVCADPSAGEISPAVASQCTVICAPSEIAPSDAAALADSAVKGIPAAATLTSQIASVLSETHTWAQGCPAERNLRIREGCGPSSQCNPSLAPQALLQFRRVFSKHEDVSSQKASISFKQELPLVRVSTVICENTGVMPKAYVKDQKFSFFSGKAGTTHIRFVLFEDTVEVEIPPAETPGEGSGGDAEGGGDAPPPPPATTSTSVREVDSVGFFTDLGNAPELLTQGSVSFEFDAAQQRISLKTKNVSVSAVFTQSQEEGQALKGSITSALSGEVTAFEASEVPQPPESAQQWLRGEMHPGARVEPQEIIEDPPPEGLDALTKRTHEMVEAERGRVNRRLQELSLDTAVGDSLVATLLMTYGTYMTNDRRIELKKKLFEFATQHGLPFRKSATRFGLYSVWLAVDEVEAAGSCYTGIDQHLPVGASWRDAAMCFLRVTHGTATESGPVRIPFLHDPNGAFTRYVVASEAASREGIGEVVCIGAGDPTLYSVCAEAVKKGKTLIVEQIGPQHWHALERLLTLQLDTQKEKARFDVPGFADGFPYSFRFKIVFVSDPNVSSVIPQYRTHCTFINCSLSGDAVREHLAETLSQIGPEFRADMKKVLNDWESCDQRLSSAEQYLESQAWDVNWENATEWYYNPTVAEALTALQTVSLKAGTLKAKLDALYTSSESSQEENKPLLSKLMLLCSSAVSTAQLSHPVRSPCVLSPWRVKDILVQQMQQIAAKGITGARAKQELQDAVLSAVGSSLIRGMHHEDRLVLTMVLAMKQDLKASGMTNGHIEAFVRSARFGSLQDHLAHESVCAAEVDAVYAQELKVHQEKVAEQTRRRLEEEAEEASERPAGAKDRRPMSGNQKTRQAKAKKGHHTHHGDLPQPPQKSPLPPECKPSYGWLSHGIWVNLLQLGSIECFSKLPGLIHPDAREKSGRVTREQRWQEFFVSLGKVPEFDKSPLTKFERLVLCLAARPDRSLATLRKYSSDLGKHTDPYANIEALNGEVLSQTRPTVGLSFVLSSVESNVEALQMVTTFASGRRVDFPQSNVLSVQDGCTSAALALIRNGVACGQWVFLANMQCADPKLLNEIALAMQAAPDDSGFRLIMTYCPLPSPAAAAPPVLVSNSVVVFISGCRGTRNAMAVLYRSIDERIINALKTHEWKRLLFAVILVVAILHERRELLAGIHGGQGNAGQGDSWLVSATSAVAVLMSHIGKLRDAERHADAHIAESVWHGFRQALASVLSASSTAEDERVIHAVIDWWVHPDVVSPGVKLCKGLTMPSDVQSLANHWQLIDAMPVSDTTELFGLHPVCESEAQQQQLDSLRSAISSALLPQPQDLAAANAFLEKLPPPFSPEDFATLHLQPGKLHSPYTDCLIDEMTALNTLLQKVRDDIASGARLRETVDGHICPEWSAWLGCTTQGQWVTAVCRAHAQLAQWLSKQRLPRPLEVGVLQRPRGVLNALRRETAKMKGVSLLDVTLCAEVMPSTSRRPPSQGSARQQAHEPLVLSGLCTTGFRWDPATELAVDVPCKNWWVDAISKFPPLRITAEVAVKGAGGGGGSGVCRPSPPERLGGCSSVLSPRRGVAEEDVWGGGGGGAASPQPGSPQAGGKRAEPVHPVSLPLLAHGPAAPLLEVVLRSQQEPNHWVLRGAAILCRRDP